MAKGVVKYTFLHIRTTNYKIEDGQVIIPKAAERKGIQPVVVLKVNGKEGLILKSDNCNIYSSC